MLGKNECLTCKTNIQLTKLVAYSFFINLMLQSYEILHILQKPQKDDSTAAKDEVAVLEPHVIAVSYTNIYVGDTYSSVNWGSMNTKGKNVISIVHMKVFICLFGWWLKQFEDRCMVATAK